MALQIMRHVQRARIRPMLPIPGARSMFNPSLLRTKFSGKPGHIYTKPPSRVRSGLSQSTNGVRNIYSSGGQSSQTVIWAIIAINTAVFVAWNVGITGRKPKLLQRLDRSFMLSLNNLREGRVYTLLTSAFSHIASNHFLFNMFTFYTFATGLTVVAGLGPIHLVSLSLAAAVGGSMAWVTERASKIRGQVNGNMSSALGASGLVMGLGSTLTCLRPFLPMNIMFIPISIPLWAVTGLYAAVDFFFMGGNTGVGHSAHLGGAAVGVIYYALFLRKLGGVSSMLRRRM